MKHHFDHNSIPMKTEFCVGCRVSIKGNNSEPEWGIFNGAIGTVREIVFQKDKNPNYGHLPSYVAVEMPSYCPPTSITTFDALNHQVSLCYDKIYFTPIIVIHS